VSCTSLKFVLCVISAGSRLHKDTKGNDTEVDIYLPLLRLSSFKSILKIQNVIFVYVLGYNRPS
jgi:hypothetical protein